MADSARKANIAVMLIAVLILALPCLAVGYDPLRPQVRAPLPQDGDDNKNQVEELRLQATLVAAQRRVAVINGARFRVGDTINGYRVQKISAARVWLKADGEQRDLRLRTRVVTRKQADGAD